MTCFHMTAAAGRRRIRLAASGVLILLALAAPGCQSLPTGGGVGAAVVEPPAVRNAAHSTEPDSESPQVAPAGCGGEACVAGCAPDFRFTDDLHCFFPQLLDDSAGIVNWHNGLMLGAATGVALAMRQDLDDQVREATARHPERWGDGSILLGKFGEAPYQIPGLLAVYGYGLYTDDPELHALSSSLISAYTIMGLSTVSIKVLADTERPTDEWNNGRYGFPSFHSASSFSIAAVLDEHYGPRAGVPLYVLAGLISWSRIDERDHDLSDVVFGAALGYVVGKSVAQQHLERDGRVRVLPYTHPTEGASGLMLDVSY